MARLADRVELPLLDPAGRTVGMVNLAPSAGRSSQPPIVILDAHEAREWYEEPVQLLEGQSYDYEVITLIPNAQLRRGVVKRSGLSDSVIERGRIDPGSHTGTMILTLEDINGKSIGVASFEVRSVKLEYRSDYREMLNDIADISLDLILELNASSSTWLRPLVTRDPPTLIQRFIFVKEVIGGKEFSEALSRIVARPHEATTREQKEQSIRQPLHSSSKLSAQLASGYPRVAVHPSHPLFSRIKSLPVRVRMPQLHLSVDTPENRFVKFVLSSFIVLLSDIESVLRRIPGSAFNHIISESGDLRRKLENLRQQAPFSEVGDRTRILPLGSSVLHGRAGYRDVLKIWLRFNMASQLSWDGGSDIFLGGKKDVATLYEYWAFFQLLRAVRSTFNLNFSDSDTLFERSINGLALKLKSGKRLSFLGTWVEDGKSLRVRFSYNRTFNRKANPIGDPEKSYPHGGSWTRPMRPDYTVSLWSPLLSEKDAEVSGKIRHLHFDAKYRIERLSQLFGEDSEDMDDTILPDEEFSDANAARSGNVKRDDLLKMHSYRDAIRRSVSAFVLYPGSENRSWRQYEDIVPGLGAISLIPGDESSISYIKSFLTLSSRDIYHQINDASLNF